MERSMHVKQNLEFVEQLIPRPIVAKELGISSRTVCRYEVEKRPGFDKPVKMGGRVFHPRSRIDAVKALGNLLRPEERA
jgi:predicted DNA-binding transcriptional regulator AlpA